MKKIVSFASALIALAAMSSLTSCQKETLGSKELQGSRIVMTVNAGACADIDDSKTFITPDGQDGYVPSWSKGDQIQVLELIEGSISQKAKSEELEADTDNAAFTVTLTSKGANPYTYTSVYPAAAYGTGGSGESAFNRLTLADEQTFSSSSFDPKADLMISKPVDFTEQPTTLTQQFRRIGATAKMQILGITPDEVIKSVKFSTDEAYIAGYSKFDPATAEWLETYSSSKKAITLTPAETMTATGEDVVWFRAYAAVLKDNFTVEATTDKAYYKKEVNLKEATRELEFRNAALTSFPVRFSERTPISTAYELVTDVNELAVGDVVRLGCASKNIAAGNVAGTAAKPYLSAVDATIENGLLSSQDALDFTLGGTSVAWTFTASDDRVLATKEVKTINLSGDGTTTWTIAIDDAGVATITSTTTACGTIKSYGDDRFNTYASGQTSIELYKKVDNPRPRQTLSFPEASYSVKNGATFNAPTVSGAKTSPVSYSSSHTDVATVDESTGVVTIVGGGTTTITATAPESDSYKSGSASYELTVLTPLDKIADIFAAATKAGSTAGDIWIDFQNWIVSGVKGNNAYVTDNSGNGFIINASEHGFKVNDVLSGQVDAKIKLSSGSAQVSGLTSTTAGLTITPDGEVTKVGIPIANLGGVNTGAVITFEKLQYNGEVFTDGTNTITPYPSLVELPALTKGAYYNVTGVYVQYNDQKEIAPRSADDFVLSDSKYLIATASKTENISADGETITIDVDTNVDSWSVTSSDDTNFKVGTKTKTKTTITVEIIVAKNTGEARTADITISDEAEDVAPVVITLSQSKAGEGPKLGDPWSYTFSEVPSLDSDKKVTLNKLEWKIDAEYMKKSNSMLALSTNDVKKPATFSTSAYNGAIGEVVINAKTNSGRNVTVTVTVGGVQFGETTKISTTTATNFTFKADTPATGELVISFTSPTGGYALGAISINPEAAE